MPTLNAMLPPQLISAFERGYYIEQKGACPIYDIACATGRGALVHTLTAKFDALITDIATGSSRAEYKGSARAEVWAALWMLRCTLAFDTLEHSDACWQMNRLTWDDCSPLDAATVQRWQARWLQ